MDTIQKRVKAVLDRQGISESALAKMININQSALNQALKRNNPSYQQLPKIAEWLGVSEDWLRNGGTPPWENDDPARVHKEFEKILGLPEGYLTGGRPSGKTAIVGEEAKEYQVELDHIVENHPLVIQLKTKCIGLCERYLDMAELCKQKDIDISQRAIDETKAFLDSLNQIKK